VYKLHPSPFLVSRYALYDGMEVSLSILPARLGSPECSHQSIFLSTHKQRWICRECKEKTKLLGIARWLQRRIMWYSGHGDALFNDASQNPEEKDDDDDDSSTSLDSHNEYNDGDENNDPSQDEESYSSGSNGAYEEWEE
jgi:hypothetical protein